MHHGATESTEGIVALTRDIALTERVIGLAIEVHRILGPGLPETAYEQCF